MKRSRRAAVLCVLSLFLAKATWSQTVETQQSHPFLDHLARIAEPANRNARSSPYVPIDSWVYPALERLSAMGYLNDAYFGLRPWTRLSIVGMLQNAGPTMVANGDDDALEIALSVQHEFKR